MIQGVPKNMGIHGNFYSHNIIMAAIVYFKKRVNDCKDVSIMSPQDEQWRRTNFSLFVYCNFLVLLSSTVYSQNINKQNVNIADESLTDYSFLSRYHHTKSKNYLKRRYRIRHWIPMSIGTPCIKLGSILLFAETQVLNSLELFANKKTGWNCRKIMKC